MIRPTRVDNVIIDVPDVARATHWYQANTGLEAVFSSPDVAVMHTADEHGTGIVLRRSEHPTRATVWFEVPDARSIADDRGLPVFNVATGLCVEIQDPWGNTLGFTDYSTRARS